MHTNWNHILTEIIQHTPTNQCFSRKLSELGSRLGFGVQGLGTVLTAAVDPKLAFRSRGSEIRLGGPGRISELRRQGLSEGPKGVSKRHLE